MRKVRVLIVEDSRVVREYLEHIIGRDPRLEVGAAVETAEEALLVLSRVSPDVISMDIRLPGINGFEATQRIMTDMPTPIVVVSSSVESEDLKITMNALAAGALSVIEKPCGVESSDYEGMADRLCTQLAIMSQVRVVRRRNGVRPPVVARTPLFYRPPGGYRMLGIVSSTGGPTAVVQILIGLGRSFPLPICLVQHITSSFLEGFAEWLEGVCPFSVEIVEGRVKPVQGKVYLPPRDRHLRLEGDALEPTTGDPVCAQKPSGTVLLESMAAELGPQALGVLLTGMGEDGAAGLLSLRKAGGHTIAEDESTAVVYGMPREAVRLGAVCESLPLPAIAPRILDLAMSRKEVA